MKKITENALLYRVNQLREKMAFYEAVGDGSQTPVGGLPSQTPTAAPEGHWYDPAVNFAKGVGDDLSYAADHAAELGQGVGQTAANMAKTVGNAAGVAGNFISGAVNGATGGTQGQQKVGANQGTQTGGKWPATPAEIQAFQKANGLKVDGLIGANTMAALQKQGVQPPAGFKPVASKQPTAQQGTAAKPAAGAAPVAGQVMPNGSVSSGDADRDERLAQANQVMNMTTDQRHAFDMAAGQKDYAATHPAASAANKAPVGGQMQSTGDPVKDSELAKQGNTIVYKEDQDLARIVQLVNW